MAKYWVSMTDTFMSFWGKAEGKINKFVVECDNLAMAKQIESAARKRSEMKYVNICVNKPKYNAKRYYVSWRKADDLGEIWKGNL